MKIAMITSEARPLAMSGGLADTIPALSDQLKASRHDVRVIMPRYYSIDTQTLDSHPIDLRVPTPMGDYECGLYRTSIGKRKVPVYLVDRQDLYGRKGLYGPDGSSAWPDNDLRYALLCHAALAICDEKQWIPDVFHLHDWQSAPLAWLLKTSPPPFSRCKSVLTIHNLGYQGVFESRARDFINPNAPSLPPDHYRANEERQSRKKYDNFNFLATGIIWSDQVTTVSPTYSREILLPEFAENLQEELLSRLDSLHGILNGMDYNSWNPASDPQLHPDNYNSLSLRGKNRMKIRLQREMGLEENPDIPLFGVVSRLTRQKGLELIDSDVAIRPFQEGRAQLALLGTGEKHLEAGFRHLAQNHSGKIAVTTGFSDPLARRIEAGADFFLMPSLYEPCGLNQLYSLRYGTIPVVRKTGGLSDTVVDLDEHPWRGTGLVFRNPDSASLAETMERAIAIYHRKIARRLAQWRGMRARFNWKKSARAYLAAYRA